jgi:hypothetical protein
MRSIFIFEAFGLNILAALNVGLLFGHYTMVLPYLLNQCWIYDTATGEKVMRPFLMPSAHPTMYDTASNPESS